MEWGTGEDRSRKAPLQSGSNVDRTRALEGGRLYWIGGDQTPPSASLLLSIAPSKGLSPPPLTLG